MGGVGADGLAIQLPDEVGGGQAAHLHAGKRFHFTHDVSGTLFWEQVHGDVTACGTNITSHKGQIALERIRCYFEKWHISTWKNVATNKVGINILEIRALKAPSFSKRQVCVSGSSFESCF